MRAIPLGLLLGLVVLAAALLGGLRARSTLASSTVDPGLNFWLDVLDVPGCDTEAGNATCVLTPGRPYAVNFNLGPLPANVPSYEGYDAVIRYQGMALPSPPVETPWPDCVFSGLYQNPVMSWFAFGCAIGVRDNPPGSLPPSTYVGTLGTFFIECTQPGSLTLDSSGYGTTDLVERVGEMFRDPAPAETLTIACGRAPTVPPDVNCDGAVDSRDALLILQLDAHLLDHLACPDVADANEDGVVDAVDASIVLQVSAGFFAETPPSEPTPTPTDTPAATETLAGTATPTP